MTYSDEIEVEARRLFSLSSKGWKWEDLGRAEKNKYQLEARESLWQKSIDTKIANLEEKVKWLSDNIEKRDNFIVKQGLWQNFVETLDED